MEYYGISRNQTGFLMYGVLFYRSKKHRSIEASSGPPSTQRAHIAKLPVGSCFYAYATSGIAICPAPWSKQSPGLTGQRGMKKTKYIIETNTSQKRKVLLTFQV